MGIHVISKRSLILPLTRLRVITKPFLDARRDGVTKELGVIASLNDTPVNESFGQRKSSHIQ